MMEESYMWGDCSDWAPNSPGDRLYDKLFQLRFQGWRPAIPGVPILGLWLFGNIWLWDGHLGSGLPSLPLAWFCWDPSTWSGLSGGHYNFLMNTLAM